MALVDDVRLIRIFQDLPDASLELVARHVQARSFPAGTAVFRRGDPGTAMFMIVDGAIGVTLTNAEGVDYRINTLGVGDTFGEMALLTGEPRSANIRCDTQVRALELDQRGFAVLQAELPEVNGRLIRLLASRLDSSTVARQRQQLEAGQLLATVLSHAHGETDTFLGASPWARKMDESIRKAAAGGQHVLVTGEAGTGKTLVAELLHQLGPRSGQPFFVLDCARCRPAQGAAATDLEPDDGSATLLELEQQSALFGHRVGSAAFAKGTRRGYLELADRGTLVLRNVEALTARTQALLREYLATRRFARLGDVEPLSSDVRLVATTREDLDARVAAGLFDPELLAGLRRERLQLIPLQQRKKDIPVLAQHFLTLAARRQPGRRSTGFSKDAMNSLVDYAWPLNAAELRQVVERAVALCDGEEVGGEHVFLDAAPFTGKGRFNLRRIEEFDWLVRHPLLPRALTWLTVPAYCATVVLLLLGPRTDNPVTVATWALFWPTMVGLAVLAARAWCGLCPIPVISNLGVAGRHRFLKVPEVMKKHGMQVATVGLLAISWAEHHFAMPQDARASGYLFLTILLVAMVTTQLFGKRSWCQHLCPLGKVVAQVGCISALELRSNSNVCSSQCRTHDCSKDRSCPMGLHPSSERTRTECVLCLECVKSCQHESVRLDLVLPREKALQSGKWEPARAAFTLVIIGTVLAVALPRWLDRHGGAGPAELGLVEDLARFVAVSLAFILLPFAAAALGARGRHLEQFAHSSYAYVPLAAAGLFGLHFRGLVEQGGRVLPLAVTLTGLDRWVDPAAVTPELGTLRALFPLLALAGLGFSLYVLKALRSSEVISAPSHRAHQLVVLATAAVFLVTL